MSKRSKEALTEEINRLRAAIRKHRSQRADDRCIEDDDELYAVLGDGIPCDRRVGDKAAMLANCARFIERRCQGGGWPSYAELEQQLIDVRKLSALKDAVFKEADEYLSGHPYNSIGSGSILHRKIQSVLPKTGDKNDESRKAT